ncbi:MAG: STAS domain-containing protein [Solirubrobacteraceae bacterium]
MPGSSPPADFTIRGPIERADLPGLCERVCTLLERGTARSVVCDVAGVAADAVAVDALARLALAARRRDCQITLRGGSSELAALVAFMGLERVLPVSAVSLPGDRGGRTGGTAHAC